MMEIKNLGMMKILLHSAVNAENLIHGVKQVTENVQAGKQWVAQHSITMRKGKVRKVLIEDGFIAIESTDRRGDGPGEVAQLAFPAINVKQIFTEPRMVPESVLDESEMSEDEIPGIVVGSNDGSRHVMIDEGVAAVDIVVVPGLKPEQM